ncbi:MAG: hypothetical protein EBX41_02785 [Chitinophagia bacterium]|nr:hypothetical protein [Chitinophagia bacterium]
MKFLSTISALFSLFIALSSTAIAQTWRSAHIVEAKATPLQIRGGMGASMARVGDTATLKNFPLSDTLVSYYYAIGVLQNATLLAEQTVRWQF